MTPATRNVLMITPHFPPDSSAGTHRVRLLAPHLSACGWEPTILTVDPRFIEGLVDEGLLGLVPEHLRVERTGAIPIKLSRTLGVGDLGLRAFRALQTRAASLISEGSYDLLYITIYPAYTALLGPLLKRTFGIPFVLDYQDPWVGSWGHTVGPANGKANLKSRLSRKAAQFLEPFALKSADAITAVSAGTIAGVKARILEASQIPSCAIPIGGDENDFLRLRLAQQHNPFFNPKDGVVHICSVGTLLPLGVDTLRAFLEAVASIREARPELYSRLRIHFFGTSNERALNSPFKVVSHAEEFGVSEIVSEHSSRIDYLDSLTVQMDASALLLMGSSEHHYTASRLYPALLARRPLLAIYHRASDVSALLRDSDREHIHLVQFGDADPPQSHAEDIVSAMISIVEAGAVGELEGAIPFAESFSARHLAGVLAGVFDRVIDGRKAAGMR